MADADALTRLVRSAPDSGEAGGLRIRHMAGLDPKGGMAVDDITYSSVDHPSLCTHPLCPNTWRNGRKIGEEPPATGY